MIPAKKNTFLEWGFSSYINRLIRRNFHQVYIQGTAPLKTEKTLFILNHSAWWDPLFVFFINKNIIKSDAYAMMHEEGLKKHPIFKSIGVFSIDRSNPKDILKSLSYAADRIRENKTVYIFPQGDEFHLEKRPLQFQSGAAYISEQVPDCNVIPISFYYSFESTKKANIYISIGNNVASNDYYYLTRKEKTHLLEESSELQLDELKRLVTTGQKDMFRQLL